MQRSTKKEYELKFEITPVSIAKLLRAEWLRRRIEGRARVRKLVAVYYDTPAFDLYAKGCVLRIRREGRRHIQCLKSRVPGAEGALARYEFEVPVPGPALRGDLIPDRELPFDRHILSRVAPMFEVETRRVLRMVDWDDQTVFELACDRTRIAAGRRSTAFTEMEVELVRGPADRLFDFGLRIARQVPCRLCVLHKADRGFRLIDKRQPWQVVEAPGPMPETTAEDACARIFLDCLHQVRQNEPFVLADGHPEAVRQFHLGLRRLRSWLRLYKAHLPAREWQAFARELDWLGELSGRVRNLAGLAAEPPAPRAALPAKSPADGRLLEATADERRRARAALVRGLRSKRYSSTLIGFLQWVDRRGWRAT